MHCNAARIRIDWFCCNVDYKIWK